MVALRRHHNWIQHQQPELPTASLLTGSPSCRAEFAAKSTTSKTTTRAGEAAAAAAAVRSVEEVARGVGAGNGSEKREEEVNMESHIVRSNRMTVDDSTSSSCCCRRRRLQSLNNNNNNSNNNDNGNSSNNPITSMSNKMADGILTQCIEYQTHHNASERYHESAATISTTINTYDSISEAGAALQQQQQQQQQQQHSKAPVLDEQKQEALVARQEPITQPIKYQLVRTTTTCYSPSITTVCSRRLAIVFAIALGSYCLLSAVKVGYCAPVSKSISHKSNNNKPMNDVIGVGSQHGGGDDGGDQVTMLAATNQQQQHIVESNQHQPDMTSSSGSIGSIGLGSASSSGDAGFVDELVDTRNTMVASKDGELAELLDEDETIVLVLANRLPTAASTSIRRLIKRSGISDQRLAEIQMIRALKKQLEKASKLAATGTGAQETGQATS